MNFIEGLLSGISIVLITRLLVNVVEYLMKKRGIPEWGWTLIWFAAIFLILFSIVVVLFFTN